MATVMAEICGAGGKIEIGSSIGSFLFSMFLTALVSLVVGKFLHMIVGLPMRVVLKKVGSLCSDLPPISCGPESCGDEGNLSTPTLQSASAYPFSCLRTLH
eukprot:scaffold45170_cov32-Tisochrysis_lutea.AAC.3